MGAMTWAMNTSVVTRMFTNPSGTTSSLAGKFDRRPERPKILRECRVVLRERPRPLLPYHISDSRRVHPMETWVFDEGTVKVDVELVKVRTVATDDYNM